VVAGTLGDPSLTEKNKALVTGPTGGKVLTERDRASITSNPGGHRDQAGHWAVAAGGDPADVEYRPGDRGCRARRWRGRAHRGSPEQAQPRRWVRRWLGRSGPLRPAHPAAPLTPGRVVVIPRAGHLPQSRLCPHRAGGRSGRRLPSGHERGGSHPGRTSDQDPRAAGGDPCAAGARRAGRLHRDGDMGGDRRRAWPTKSVFQNLGLVGHALPL
jgi:hypothetical protein